MTQVSQKSAIHILKQRGKKMSGAELRYYSRVAGGESPRKPTKGPKKEK